MCLFLTNTPVAALDLDIGAKVFDLPSLEPTALSKDP